MNRGTYTLYDSTSIPTYEDYLNWCAYMGAEPSCNGFNEFTFESHGIDIQTLKYLLAKYANCPCVVFGQTITNFSESAIKPVKVASLYDGVKYCFPKYADVTVTQRWGHVEVDIYEHDSITHYQVWLLSDKGISTTTGDLTKERYHKAMESLLLP